MEQNRVRIADIADALGLSTATVSNVIHGKMQKFPLPLIAQFTGADNEREA